MGGEKDTYMLAWTTTPWTLPSNQFLVVNPADHGSPSLLPVHIFYALSCICNEFKEVDSLIGFWVDHDKDYITLNRDYMESEWWALKTMFEKQLLFKDFKILQLSHSLISILLLFQKGSLHCQRHKEWQLSGL